MDQMPVYFLMNCKRTLELMATMVAETASVVVGGGP
jgi:hypothetical protein